MSRLLATALAASVIGAAAGCSGSSETFLPDQPRDASSEPSPTTSRGDASSAHEVGSDHSEGDAPATTARPADAGAPHDVNGGERRVEAATNDGSPRTNDSAVETRRDAGHEANTRDAAPQDAARPVPPESSTPANDAHLTDGSSRACGVPNDCIVSAPLPTQTNQRFGMAMTLCPGGANAASGVCIVEANLGDASWGASADAGPNVLEGRVGLRGRDIVLVVSTLFGPVTCHFAVGDSDFVPVPFQIRLASSPTSASVVGCSALMVGEVTPLGEIPTTVTGPSLCSDVVLPQLRPMVLQMVAAGLQGSIQRQVCLR